MSEQEFLAALNQHKGIIYKICHLYRDTREDREDLFQEIVFQLWRSYPSFKGNAKVSSWMYRIALNTALAAFRKRKAPVSYHSDLPEWPPEPEEHQAAQRELLWDAIKKLDDVEKALVTLYLEDMSYQEIAAVMGISESNTGVRLNRIKEKIRKHLKQ